MWISKPDKREPQILMTILDLALFMVIRFTLKAYPCLRKLLLAPFRLIYL